MKINTSIPVARAAVERAELDLHWLELQLENPFPSAVNIRDGAQRVMSSMAVVLGSATDAPAPVTLQLTKQEAHTVLRALATANGSTSTATEDKGPNTWVANRLLKLVEEN